MFHSGKILRRSRISPTVMMLDIEIPSLPTFEPGQWVDFVAKPNDWVGGFSIASSPRDLPRITLAIKNSNDPPATWVHDDNRSSVGARVEVRLGGNCVLDKRLPLRPSVFCAGGIGISPILSQYREFLFLRDTANVDDAIEPAPSMFLFTASSAEELVFARELSDMSRKGSELGRDRMVFAITRETNKNDISSSSTSRTERKHQFSFLSDDETLLHVERRTGRVLTEFLDESPSDANYYICGPPSMIDDAVRHLRTVRTTPLERIKHERWW